MTYCVKWKTTSGNKSSIVDIQPCNKLNAKLYGDARFSHSLNNKHLRNVGPIRHCEPPHAHSPGVATGTVARRLRIDVHDDNDENDDNDNDNA